MSKKSRCHTCGHTPGRRVEMIMTENAPPPCTCHCHSTELARGQGAPEGVTEPPVTIPAGSGLVVPGPITPEIAMKLFGPLAGRRLPKQ